MPRFKIARLVSGEIFASFLVVASVGGVTFGVWKRHTDFQELAEYLRRKNDEVGCEGDFKNSLLSWQCLLYRKQWYRCLDKVYFLEHVLSDFIFDKIQFSLVFKDYLALKCFLLERFMHDVLFESQNPHVISDFLGLSKVF